MTSLKYWTSTAAAFVLYMGLMIGYAAHIIPMLFASAMILGVWALVRWDQACRIEAEAWENRYANMTDTQKVDYHLKRSRRLGTIHDAEIAQAIIQRNCRA